LVQRRAQSLVGKRLPVVGVHLRQPLPLGRNLIQVVAFPDVLNDHDQLVARLQRAPVEQSTTWPARINCVVARQAAWNRCSQTEASSCEYVQAR
jgi:hypothetical protein